MAYNKKKRFFKPDINKWKYEKDDNESSDITEDEASKSVREHFNFFNWTISFTKNVVQSCFILFIIANIYICFMITYVFITSSQITALDTYISQVFNMFVVVIGGYIVKSATENTVKIAFSVLSDWLEKKYGITDRLKEPENNNDGSMNTIIVGGKKSAPEDEIKYTSVGEDNGISDSIPDSNNDEEPKG